MSNGFDIQPRQRLGAQVVEAINRAEVDIQISTAKQYPRVISKALETAEELATSDEATAASCFYAIPRDGKVITGPSVRLAEIVAYAWKNLRVATRIVDESESHLVAQAVCHDLENNVALSREVRIKIVGRNGRYSEDMIAVTANAACSKAMRDVIFDVIPLSVIRPVIEAAQAVSQGNEATLAARRVAMIQHFEKLGAKADRVLAAIERRTVEDVTLEDMVRLRGFATAIKEGDATVGTIFPEEKPQTTADKIKGRAKANSEKLPDPSPPDSATPATEERKDIYG